MIWDVDARSALTGPRASVRPLPLAAWAQTCRAHPIRPRVARLNRRSRRQCDARGIAQLPLKKRGLACRGEISQGLGTFFQIDLLRTGCAARDAGTSMVSGLPATVQGPWNTRLKGNWLGRLAFPPPLRCEILAKVLRQGALNESHEPKQQKTAGA